MREGYVSIEAAREQYGVVIDAATMKADVEQTEALRARMRAQGLPKDQPLTSKASPPSGARLRLLDGRGGRRLLGARERAWEAEIRAAGLLRDRCCS